MSAKTLQCGMALLLFVCFLLAGCASDKPVRSMANAETSLQRAREAKAIEYAPVELRRAEEKLSAARQAMDEEKYDQARRLADEARADAELAETQARSAQTQKMAREMRQSIDTLRSELSSGTAR